MPLFGPSQERVEHLRTVLELEQMSSGSASGEVDGTRIELSERGEVCIPIRADWPEPIADLPPKHRWWHGWAHFFLSGTRWRNRSRHPTWMNAVFSRPWLRNRVVALELRGTRVEVHDDALRLFWNQEVDVPALRHFVRELVEIARQLPAEMTTVVGELASTRVEAQPRSEPHPRSKTASTDPPSIPTASAGDETSSTPRVPTERKGWGIASRLFRALIGAVGLPAVLLFLFAPGILATRWFHDWKWVASIGSIPIVIFLGGLIFYFRNHCDKCHSRLPRKANDPWLGARRPCPKCGHVKRLGGPEPILGRHPSPHREETHHTLPVLREVLRRRLTRARILFLAMCGGFLGVIVLWILHIELSVPHLGIPAFSSGALMFIALILKTNVKCPKCNTMLPGFTPRDASVPRVGLPTFRETRRAPVACFHCGLSLGLPREVGAGRAPGEARPKGGSPRSGRRVHERRGRKKHRRKRG